MTQPPVGSSLVQAGQDTLAVTETTGTAMASAAKAMVEAAYIIALRNPRNMERCRQRLLAECDRPAFAEAARYAKPTGEGKIYGLSIRFAEAAMRELGNLDCQQFIVFDDDGRRGMVCVVRDLEGNSAVTFPVLIEKKVERKRPDATREKLGERKNSKGETVYIVAATEEEVFMKQNAMLSKARRNAILNFLPSDIADECERRCQDTLAKEDKTDPKAALRRITGGFFDLGVDAATVQAMIGHDLESISPAELNLLRVLYTGLREGETTLADILEAVGVRDADAGGPGAKRGLAGLKLALGISDKPKADKKANGEKKAEPPPASEKGAEPAGGLKLEP